MWMTVQSSGSLVSWGCQGPWAPMTRMAVCVFQVGLDRVDRVKRMRAWEVHVLRHPVFEYRCADVLGDRYQCRLVLRRAGCRARLRSEVSGMHQELCDLAQTIEWGRPAAWLWSCRRGAVRCRSSGCRTARRAAWGRAGCFRRNTRRGEGRRARSVPVFTSFAHFVTVSRCARGRRDRPAESAIPGQDRETGPRRGSGYPVKRSPWECARGRRSGAPSRR